MRRVSGRWAATATLLAVLSVWLFGCGSGGSPPAGGVALKEGGELAAWSPNGQWIAAPGERRIDLIDRDGATAGRLTVPGIRHATWPCECRLGWSPGGRYVLFMTRRWPGGDGASVGSVDRVTGAVRQRNLGEPAGDAAWSPSGWPLVFVVNSGAYEFNTPHRGPKPNLWRLDGLHSRPHPILRQAGTEAKPQFSPDGTQVAYVRKLKGQRQLWVVNSDGSHPHAVATDLLSVSFAWAPDATSLALAASFIGGRGNAIYTTPTSDGRPRRVSGSGDATGAVAWTPDGRWITYGGLGGTIWRMHPDGGDRQKIGELPEHLIRRLLWSPDGKHLAYAAIEQEEEGFD